MVYLLSLSAARLPLCAFFVTALLACSAVDAARLGMTSSEIKPSTTKTSINKPFVAIIPKEEEEQYEIMDEPATLLEAATSSLEATWAGFISQQQQEESSSELLFPNVVDEVTGQWRVDTASSSTGAAGLFATSLWMMSHLDSTSSHWTPKAQAATLALAASPALSDPSLGQAVATLAYPALRYAYESASATDSAETEIFLAAALTAADTLSKMYVRVAGVIKVRPTADIAAEARAASVAHVSPLAAFSSVEGSAAATGLLVWASTLPGGKLSWKEMALRNAKRIAQDHMTPEGIFRGTMVYSSVSSTTPPTELHPLSSSAAASHTVIAPNAVAQSVGALDEMLTTVFDAVTGTHTPRIHASSTSSEESSGVAMDAWLSSVGGVTSTQGLRQAMGTLTLIESARAAASSGRHSEAVSLLAAAEAAAVPLLARTSSAVSAANDPLSSAAAAAALAELSSIAPIPMAAEEYAEAARRLIINLSLLATATTTSTDSSFTPLVVDSSSSSKETDLATLASRWLSKLIPSSRHEPQSILFPLSGDAEAEAMMAAQEADLAALATEESVSAAFEAEVLINQVQAGSSLFPERASILPGSIGSTGSMLADQLLLQALLRLTTPIFDFRV